MYYELTPKFDSAKSFYGKALVYSRIGNTNDGHKHQVVELSSYGTVVCDITYPVDPDVRSWNPEIKIRIYGQYNRKAAACPKVWNQTTLRHIKEFLRQHNFKADTWEELKQYVVEEE